jgi:hypothetical protein
MNDLGGVIRDRLDEWGVSTLPLERTLFDSEDPDVIAMHVDAWCRQHLGAFIDHYEFFDSSSASVHGVVLRDGRRVVVKGHGRYIAEAYIAASTRVQRSFADAGWPVPRPLAHEFRITSETMLGPFPKVDAHDPSVRRTLAHGLAAFIAEASALDPTGLEHPLTVPEGALYPAPHSERFDFDATQAGAEWIDDRARTARARAIDERRVIAHGDWRIDNVRVADGRIVAIYDWDSVGLLTDTGAVAAAATTFSVDWDQPQGRRFPTPAESAAFIAEYEEARGASLDHDGLSTAIIATLAYGARCEHAAGSPHAATDDSFTARLRAVDQI